MKNNSVKRPRRWWLLLPVVASMLLTTSCREDYYLDEEEPAWLGGSIYDFLKEEGKYDYFVRLIDDLDYAEVLSKTGSKTLFVVDDATFDAFLSNNDWGVSSYEQLSDSHKKLLLNSSMLNNVYFSDMLGYGADRVEGRTIRRTSAVSIYDNLAKVPGSKLPESPYWDKYRKDGMVLLKDNTPAPLVNLTHDYLTINNLTGEDYRILTNQDSSYVYDKNDVFINGVRIAEPNLKCKNGVVHRMEKLITPLTNMAEVVSNDVSVSRFSQLLNRFAAPYYSRSASLEYQRIYGGSDSVYVKKYMATHSHNNGLSVNFLSTSVDNKIQISAPADTLVESYLKFDPGWNTFTTSDLIPMSQDMGVMFVPSDEALKTYWETGGGEFLKDRFGSWENVPDYVIDDFVNNHMKPSLIASVPSKFNQVKNDGQVEMGVKIEDVERTIMCCNGVVYITNRVFPPVSYVAVSAPTLVNENMKIMRWAIEAYGFDAYLLSMDSYYSFVLPTDEALKHYIDPLSIAKGDPELWEFFFDEKTKRVKAKAYKYDLETLQKGEEISPAPANAQVDDRLEDLIDNHIIVDNIDQSSQGKLYYRTKANGTIKVEVDPTEGLNVFGGYQIENSTPIHVTTENIKDQTKEGNGKTYIVPSVMQSSIKSVYAAISEQAGTEEAPGPFYEFHKLMNDAGVFFTNEDFASFGQTVESFNTYHYTVYVPSNESVREALAAGLPTMEDAEEFILTQEENYSFDEDDYRDSIKSIIADFVNYHIQDNSVYVGGGNTVGNFETSTLDESTGTFCRLSVTGSNTGITIEDGAGNTQSVDTSDPALYNIMTRDYLFDNSDLKSSKQIETSSFAVVHRIPQALYHKKGQIEDYIKKVERLQQQFSSNE